MGGYGFGCGYWADGLSKVLALCSSFSFHSDLQLTVAMTMVSVTTTSWVDWSAGQSVTVAAQLMTVWVEVTLTVNVVRGTLVVAAIEEFET